jgi:hypothetical protein
MTTVQKNAIVTPATGLVVYDNDLLNQSQYNGSSWVSGSQIILNEFPAFAVTGTVSETFYNSPTAITPFIFAPNTFPASCMPNIKLKFTKSGGTDSCIVRLKVNTTNTTVGAVQIGTFTFTTLGASIIFNRNPLIKSNVLSIVTSTASIQSDEVTFGTVDSTTTFNTSSNMYLFVSIQQSTTSDTTTFQSIKITK